MNDVMVDIETLDTKSSAVILSIGAVRFNIQNPEEILSLAPTFHMAVDIDSCLAAHRSISGDTLIWWLSQKPEAQERIVTAERHPLEHVLREFAKFIRPTDRVWGNGASFDNSILADAYKRSGIELPWRFWNDMCYRTVKNLNGHIKAEKREGVHHDALDDAIYQAKHLQQIFAGGRSE